MQSIPPRITRLELQQLIRQRQWPRLRQRLEHASRSDIVAQLRGLRTHEQSVIRRLAPFSSL